MLDLAEIERAIAELESEQNHNRSMCAMLADLYAIRDHIQEPTYNIAYSQAASPIVATQPMRVSTSGNSDFLKLVDGKDESSAWDIMDDLMDTLRVVNPRVYASVMHKMENL